VSVIGNNLIIEIIIGISILGTALIVELSLALSKFWCTFQILGINSPLKGLVLEMFLTEVSYDHQGYIYLTKNTLKSNILKYY